MAETVLYSGPATSQSTAREIMADDYIAYDDALRHFGAVVPEGVKRVAAGLDPVPFGPDALHACRGTHVLVPGLPVGILDLQAAHGDILYSKRSETFEDDAFAWQRPALGWYLLRKEPVPGSLNRLYEDQVGLVTPGDSVPRACDAVYAAALYYLAQGRRLFTGFDMRCRDWVLPSTRPLVRWFSYGLVVYCDFEDDKGQHVGLASMREP